MQMYNLEDKRGVYLTCLSIVTKNNSPQANDVNEIFNDVEWPPGIDLISMGEGNELKICSLNRLKICPNDR